uniref:Uncharacterized protein n=1 Tax=Cajanus cajan TaxID=3821 RepID=A0A151SQV5_CAJCA|nr:hypothetical protein KK1_003472 [Cajanus cajan]
MVMGMKSMKALGRDGFQPFFYKILAPQCICDKLNQLCCSFIWFRDGVSTGWSLIWWDQITKPKINGGLGICVACSTNTALLGKLI